MEQLPGSDSIFLAMETPDAPAHVGGLTLLDTSDCPDFDFDKLVATVDQRIRLEPRFTQKLREVAFGLDRPYLVDDSDFDVRRHIHRIAAPAPGGMRELSELASYLHARALHRDRPLWEMWFIEGVEGGGCALLMKSHHCLMDGAAGAGLGELLCDLSPDAPPRVPQPVPSDSEAPSTYSDLEVSLRAARNLARSPGRTLSFGGRMLRQTAAMLLSTRQEGSPPLPFEIPATPFNAAVGPRRAFACGSVSLEDVKAVKKHFDVTVNDVVLALAGSAVRDHLKRTDALPDESLAAIIAVSKRQEGDDEVGNQVTMVPCKWATDEPDPVERLRKIHRNANLAKDFAANYDADMAAGMGDAFPPGLTNLFIRTLGDQMAPSLLPGNVVVSNVRGTPVPLYVAGARIESMYPLSILAPGQGLNITVVSYMGNVDVGFIADPDLVDDVWALAEGVRTAMQDLLSAVAETARPLRRAS